MYVGNKIPWNAGTIFHAAKPPRAVYCPRAISMKNTGIPPHTKQIRYGTKNAPSNDQTKLKLHSSDSAIFSRHQHESVQS